MKAIFGILALFLVATNAGIIEQSESNYGVVVEDLMNEGKQAAIDSYHQLEHQYEEIIADPLHQVEEALEGIEARKVEDEACVVAQDPYIEAVVNEMHDEMTHCGVVAAKTSAEIATDVSRATHQLVFDGYDCLKTYQKCKSYKNSVLKSTCYTRLSVKVTLYSINARRSIKTIKNANKRVPLVFTDADTCTHSAADKAVADLEVVHKNIDACVHKL